VIFVVLSLQNVNVIFVKKDVVHLA